jgi:hypothetical protein
MSRDRPKCFFLVAVVFFLRLSSPLIRCHDTQQSYPHTAFTDELQGCWYVLIATLTTVNVDEPLADISLAAFGRKEIEIAEVCLVAIVLSRVPKICLIE